jgi:hypothetical protein
MPAVTVIDTEQVAPEKAVARLDVDQCLVTPKPEPPSRDRTERYHQQGHGGENGRGAD